MAGTTVRCTAALVGVNVKTAAYYYQRLREIIVAQTEQEYHEVFDGEIEVDGRNAKAIDLAFRFGAVAGLEKYGMEEVRPVSLKAFLHRIETQDAAAHPALAA